MGSWHRRNQSEIAKTDNHDDLLVFGYSSRIFPSDDQSDFISEERHMVHCLGDPENRVDRYDCRLLLTSLDEKCKTEEEHDEACPAEAMEEDMCEEERYSDMYKDIKDQQIKEEEEEKRRQSSSKASFNFDYGTKVIDGETNEDESDSEDEPFEAPEGIKFPVGLILPPNMKLHHIIERTASFVVSNGAQMEIVIKAKQRNNAEQFGFLDFDHQLYPFYKYIQKLIREKKYVPELNKKVKKKSGEQPKSTSLLDIAKNHATDSEMESDSDSDCELHPSLFAASAKKSEKSEKTQIIGPKSKPSPIFVKPPAVKDISQRNDVYASLFKNIAHVTREVQGVQEIQTPGVQRKTPENQSDSDGRQDDPEYRDWFEKFYHYPCPWIGPKPMLPPTPDVEPVVNSYAEYVARKGVDFEKSLASRTDLQLHFMDPKSPYYSYYHHRIRMFQWQMTQDYNNYKNNLASIQSTKPVPIIGPESSKITTLTTPSLLDLTIPPPNYIRPTDQLNNGKLETEEQQPNLNRKQRRRLIEVNRGVEAVAEPGVIDPIAIRVFTKTEPKRDEIVVEPVARIVPFTVNKIEEKSLANSVLVSDEIPSTSAAYDPDVGDIVQDVKKEVQTGELHELEPPAPPAIPNNTQLDRKEKARIFMEKLLREKKIKKQREEEEEEQKRVEQEAEKTRLESAGPVKVKSIDELINSRISSLLSDSGFEKEKTKEEQEEVTKSDRKRKKHKKSRSRSRSVSPDVDHKKSRKSSHHRRRSRSRSRSRSRRNRENR